MTGGFPSQRTSNAEMVTFHDVIIDQWSYNIHLHTSVITTANGLCRLSCYDMTNGVRSHSCCCRLKMLKSTNVVNGFEYVFVDQTTVFKMTNGISLDVSPLQHVISTRLADKKAKILSLDSNRYHQLIVGSSGPLLSQYKDGLSRYGFPMLKIRRSCDPLIFNMGIYILVRHLYIETTPWSSSLHTHNIFFKLYINL